MKLIYILFYFIFFIFGIILTAFFNITFALTGIIGIHIAILLSFVTLKTIFSLAFKKRLPHFFSLQIIMQGFAYIILMELLIILYFPGDSFLPEKLLIKSGIIQDVDEKTCPTKELFDDARDFFGKSIDLSVIKFLHGGAPQTMFLINPKREFAMASNNTIYLRHSVCIGFYEFMHEYTHVLQFQQGKLYGPKALIDSSVLLFWQIVNYDKLYNYEGEKGLLLAKNTNKNFSDFNIEQQAEIVANFYIAQHHYVYDSRGREFTPEYISLLGYFANQMLSVIETN